MVLLAPSTTYVHKSVSESKCWLAIYGERHVGAEFDFTHAGFSTEYRQGSLYCTSSAEYEISFTQHFQSPRNLLCVRAYTSTSNPIQLGYRIVEKNVTSPHRGGRRELSI